VSQSWWDDDLCELFNELASEVLGDCLQWATRDPNTELAVRVCELTSLSPSEWAKLTLRGRLGWLKRAVEVKAAAAAGEGGRTGGEEPACEPEAAYSLRRAGGAWQVVWQGRRAIVQDCLGLHVLQQLVEKEGRPVPIMELDAAGRARGTSRVIDEPAVGGDDRKPRVDRLTGDDRQALAKLQERLDELNAVIEKADDIGDATMAEVHQRERRQLLDAVSQIFSGGKVATEASKAIDRVRKRLKRAYKAIEQAGLPEAAAHFEAAVELSGGQVTYSPRPTIDWSV